MLKKSTAINDVKRTHHFIKLLMIIGVSIQQTLGLQRCHRLTMKLILWLIKTLSCWKMVRRICEITVTLYFIFRLVLCSHEDVSFNIICLNVLEGIKQFYLSMWFEKKRLETPCKCDNAKAIIKTSNYEKLVLYFSDKSQKGAAFAMLFGFSVNKQSLENVFGFLQ